MDRQNGRSLKRKLCDDNDFLPGHSQSRKIPKVEQSPDRSINLFLGPDDFARCSLTKVVQVAEPILSKLVVCISENKTYSDTLETYALKRMKPKLLVQNFTREQISIIQQNQNFDKFDLTLKIRWVEVFININKKLKNDKDLKARMVSTLKKLKTVRNDLCHNREQFTKSQCHDLAHDLKDVLGELLQIMRNWDIGMDICKEKKKTEAAIDTRMKGDISKEDFNYMCLQKVLNHVVEPALNTVVKLICYNKTEDNFFEFFTKNGMNGTKFKNTFFKEEKITMKSKSVNVKLDVTLCSKIINVCKEWHDILANDESAKKELSNIISKIRDIRNHISHNILSMSQEECNSEAYRLRNSLEDLAHFVEKKKMYKKLDVPVIHVEQVFSDIKSIMSSPYPYS